MSGIGGVRGRGGPADLHPVDALDVDSEEFRRNVTWAILDGDAESLEQHLTGVTDVDGIFTVQVEEDGVIRSIEEFSLLQLAAAEGKANCVEVLLKKRSQAHTMNFGQLQEPAGLIGTVRELSPIYLAAMRGHADCLRLMLRGIDDPRLRENILREGKRYPSAVLGISNFTPLQVACLEGHADCAEALLEFDCPGVNQKNRSTLTALHCAAMGGKPECVDVLLKFGANVDGVTQRGQTPLMLACKYGKEGCVDRLLARGANPQLRDNFQHSALHHAAFNNSPGCVRALLKAGMHFNAEFFQNLEPLCLAERAGFRALLLAQIEAEDTGKCESLHPELTVEEMCREGLAFLTCAN